MILNLIFSFYFTANLLFPLSKPNENPGVGREFGFVFKIKKMNFYIDYSEIEVASGSDIFVKNYEMGVYLEKDIKNLVLLSFSPGLVYASKEKDNLSEKGYYISYNFLITIKKEIFPYMGIKTLYDGKTFLNYLKLGVIFDL